MTHREFIVPNKVRCSGAAAAIFAGLINFDPGLNQVFARRAGGGSEIFSIIIISQCNCIGRIGGFSTKLETRNELTI